MNPTRWTEAAQGDDEHPMHEGSLRADAWLTARFFVLSLPAERSRPWELAVSR